MRNYRGRHEPFSFESWSNCLYYSTMYATIEHFGFSLSSKTKMEGSSRDSSFSFRMGKRMTMWFGGWLTTTNPNSRDPHVKANALMTRSSIIDLNHPKRNPANVDISNMLKKKQKLTNFSVQTKDGKRNSVIINTCIPYEVIIFSFTWNKAKQFSLPVLLNKSFFFSDYGSTVTSLKLFCYYYSYFFCIQYNSVFWVSLAKLLTFPRIPITYTSPFYWSH